MPSKTREEDIDVDEAPTSIDPYETLSLSKDATQDQVKSAYRKAALKHHPDKASPSEKDSAHTKFQEIAFAYAILSDARRRKRYDTTGSTEESLDLEDDDFDWAQFFREQFAAAVTEEAIERFAGEYKGSEEERGHVLGAYVRFEGRMGRVYEEVMLSDVLVDDERFRGIIDAAIESGEVEAYKKYTNETEKSKAARIKQAKRKRDGESQEVEEVKKEMEEKSEAKSKAKKKADGDGGDFDLGALIAQRQQAKQANADKFFDRLEEKYAPKGKKGGSKREMDEPPEEAFARNAKKGKSIR